MFSEKKLSILRDHLNDRKRKTLEKSGFSIVFDVTEYCNLRCIGCCVNATYSDTESSQLNHSMSLSEIKKVIVDIERYTTEVGENNIYINFGGGEPFIRNDFHEILKFTRACLPNSKIAVDTNGTILNIKELENISNCIDVLGVSIDGLEDSHNAWRNPANVNLLGFQKVMSSLSSLLQSETLQKKVEVTCVANSKNIEEIPLLVRKLEKIGVPTFSIHRAMSVGRLHANSSYVPSAQQYFSLAVNLAELTKELNIDCHIHHSLEDMYRSVIFSEDTRHDFSKYGKTNLASSLAVDPKGNVHIDPWFTEWPWSQLTIGSCKEHSFQNLLSDTNARFDLFRPRNRCDGCEVSCSGGSRIAAAASSLAGTKRKDIDAAGLIASLDSVDPACPLKLEIEVR